MLHDVWSTSLVKQYPLLILCIWNPDNTQATSSRKGIKESPLFLRPLQMQCRIAAVLASTQGNIWIAAKFSTQEQNTNQER